jgi:deoxyxylulose-5-phosphate synthase
MEAVAGSGSTVRIERLGIPQEFLDHAGRPAILDRIGLTVQGCVNAARRLLDEPE